MVCTLICKTEDVCEDGDNEIPNQTEQMGIFFSTENEKRAVLHVCVCQRMRNI